MASIYANLQAFWEDDFKCLQSAGDAVNDALRSDEAAPNADTYGKSQAAGTHQYYQSSKESQNLVHTKSVPLPPLLQQQLKNTKISSFMGLLAEAKLAYLTVDHILYLWCITDNSICSFAVPSGQPILSVGIVPPKKGIFQPNVTWVLVVTTPDEVLLCALCGPRPIQLVPTHFGVSTDLVQMLKVAGEKSGRIFLGGADGNVYEIEYGANVTGSLKTVEDRLNGFYDGNDLTPNALEEPRPGAQGRKRVLDLAWSNPRKCRKLNHGSSFVPIFMTPNRGKISALCVDQNHQALYSLSSKGILCSYRLRDMKEYASLNLLTTARSYLEAVGRGQLLAPRNCQFGSGAAAGVGGMQGARAILKLEHLLEPKSLHMVHPDESTTITVVVVTAGGVRLYLSSISNRTPFGGVKKSALGSWKLCHIRAPPLLAQSTLRSGVPAASRRVVNASWYGSGCYVEAIDGKHFQATTPDAMLRPVDNGSLVATEKTGPSKLVLSGGITETLSLPMISARGSASDEQVDTLPGGIVRDVEALSTSDSLWDLTRMSQTPSKAEVELGLPPVYLPPGKIKALAQKKNVAQTTALVPTSGPNSLASTCLTLAGNILQNALFSRPLLAGISHPTTKTTKPPDYRISSRSATHGFSRTAEEGAGKRNIGRSTSARLRPWLLRPPVVPLSPFATHHLPSEQECIVAVNVNGLHFFSTKSVLTNLAHALMAAGENVARDASVTSFFKKYGYPEGCSMCLALACGCGERIGVDVGRRAIDAALARGYVPRLTTRPSGATPSAQIRDPLVPHDLDFAPSFLYEGMVSLVSRLLRPVWHKPAVVVTEGRIVKTPWSTQPATTTPAKVELLLDENTMEQLRIPLQNLEKLMLLEFGRAVKTVPGGRTENTDRMDVDDSVLLSRDFGLQVGEARSTEPLSTREAEQLAHLLEEKNIHILYRLISRTIQLLNLIALLQRELSSTQLRLVEWGLLHGLTISQLVQTSEGQDRLENLLNSLFTSAKAVAVESDRVVTKFASDCYLFFSPGSLYAYKGLRQASEARNTLLPPRLQLSFTKEAAASLCRAAKHWHSAPLITGRILHRSDKDDYDLVARRAIECGSPLALAVQALISLEDVASAVQVCRITAKNFQDQQRTHAKHSDVSVIEGVEFATSWEARLYHKRREGSNDLIYSSGSPSQTHVQGAAVTNKDAVNTCYALIFYHLKGLLSSNTDLAYHMVSACSAFGDKQFLASFFQYLCDIGETGTLLRIASVDLESWLKSRKDTDLLSRYYYTQERYGDGGRLLWDYARNNDTSMPLSDRIDYLNRAEVCFESARQGGDAGNREAVDASETLLIAKLQYRILKAVESWEPNLPAELTAEQYDDLKFKLVDVSVLYNDYATSLSLWDHCLLILHACKHNDAGAIQKVWTFIIACLIMPCSTRNQAAYQFLRKFVAGVEVGDDIELLGENQAVKRDSLFELGDWMRPLEERVVGLGKELHGKGADYVFPVGFLVATLEGLSEHTLSVQAGWALVVLAKSGVQYMTLLDVYEAMIQQEAADAVGESGAVEHHLKRWDAVVSLLQHWVFVAKSGDGSQADTAQKELQGGVASGRLQPKLEALRGRLEATPGASELIDRLASVQRMIR